MTILGLTLAGPLGFALAATALMLTIALALCTWRLLVGPSLSDRVVALDAISILLVAFFVVFAMASGVGSYLDVAIVMSLVAFLATVAFARFIERTIGGSDD